MTLFAIMRLPRSVVLGSGQRASLCATATAIGRRALVVTDARLQNDAQFLALIADLTRAGVETEVFGDTEADLPLPDIEACIDHYADYRPDLVIGVGGGSCIDMAKCVSTLLKHGGKVRDYYGENQVPGPILPVIALPTTAGTGSEVSPVAVVADIERRNKFGIASPYLIPHAAICDPELTLSCPPALTASAGVDALTHAIEAFSAGRRGLTAEMTQANVFVGKNEFSDSFALLSITRIWRYLRRAYMDGSDLEAREGMMLAALASGCAFGAAGTAAAHAIQYPVGNETHTPHGVGVALLLPYVMEYNRPSCEAAFAEIARAIGITGADERELSVALIEQTAELLAAVGIPKTLAELGMPRDKLQWTAESAMGAARLINNNPRKLDLPAMQRIVDAAYTGTRNALREY